MNGNSRLVIFLAMTAFVYSCSSTKKVVNNPVEPIVVQPVEPEEPVVNEEVIDTIADIPDDLLPEILDSLPSIPGKSNYHISLLLPFNIAGYQPSYQDPALTDFDRSTAIAIEFYQGFELAIEKIKKPSVGAEITVLDTRNSEARLKQLLNTQKASKTDLIIGPIFNDDLRIAADYCKKEEIPMISPLSPSTSITENNAYYFTANATPISHYETMLHYIEEHYSDEPVFIIHSGSEKELEVIRHLRRINQSENSEHRLTLREIELPMSEALYDLRKDFDSLQQHVVIMPSYEEVYINFALNKLAQVKTYYSSVVFGMPTWINYQNLNFDYLEWLNVHITQSYYTDEDDPETRDFQQEFREKYGMGPSTYAYQGYDLAHFVMTWLSGSFTAQRSKEQFFVSNNTFDGLQTSFKFVPREDAKSGKINYWDNQYVHMLNFKDFKYLKAE